jgi:rhodanese-related sulfurtransferase
MSQRHDVIVPTISAEETYARLIHDSETERPIIIDVREPDEWAQGHIEGAIHIPLMSLNQRYTEISQDREVIVVCHLGLRSEMATIMLLRKGYPNARNMLGGMDAWEAHHLPIDR